MGVLDSVPASVPPPPSLPQVDPEFWKQLRDVFASHWESLPHNLHELLGTLQSMHALHGILLILAGLVYLIVGWRIFKVLVILNAVIFGAMLGGMITMEIGREPAWWAGAFLGAVAVGLLAGPLMKLFVVMSAGAIGAYIALTLFQQIVLGIGRDDLLIYGWAAGAAGAIVLGTLSISLFRTGVMVATALQGGAMLVCGLLTLLFKSDFYSETMSDYLLEHRPVLMLIVIGVGLAGVAIQIASAERHKKRKNQKKTEAA